MAIYYIKNGGTATGDAGRETTARTGAWNANVADYFDSKISALATTGTEPTSGDFFYFADDHDKAYLSDVTYVIPDGLTDVSVDVTDQAIYKRGALEQGNTSGYYDITFNFATNAKFSSFYGVSFLASNMLEIGATNKYIKFVDCELGFNKDGNNRIDVKGDGVKADFIDVDFKFLESDQYMKVSGGGDITVIGGSVSILGESVVRAGGAGGGIISLENIDFNQSSGAIATKYSGIVDDLYNTTVKRCSRAAGLSLYNGTPAAPNQIARSWSLLNNYSAEVISHYGQAITSTIVKRIGGAEYYTSSGFSFKTTPSANVTENIQPFRFMLKTPKLDLTDGTTTLTCHVLLQDSVGTPVSLTDMNCVLKAVYPDLTDTALGKTSSSTIKSVIATPADLPIETLTFTGTSGTTKQHYLSVEIPQNTATGMDEAVCELWLEVSKDLSTGTTEMFVCPEPTVS